MTHQRRQTEILNCILDERDRQEALRWEGKLPWTCADIEPTRYEKLAVLAEEAGEVARAVCESDLRNLKEELIQTAAVCVAWLESLPPVE